MKPIFTSLAVAALIAAPWAAHAQSSNPPSANTAAADQSLHQEQREFKDTYRSGNEKAITQERTELRDAYGADYAAHHPKNDGRDKRTPAEIAADRGLAEARADMKQAYRTGNPEIIAKARASERAAYGADYEASHPDPRSESH